MPEAPMSENQARALFTAAMIEHRCAELLLCLFDGGSATVDPDGHVVMVSAEQLAQMFGD